MKRFIAGIMSVVLAVGLMPAAAFGVGLQVAEVNVQGDASGSDWTPAPTTAEAQALESLSDDFTVSRVGVGGHGAVFHPVISPFDHDTMIASCDMGGFYVTHDAGSNWKTFSLGGRIWATAADPVAKGTFYAGGSGLWRSTDNGDGWQMIWPKSDAITDVQSKLNHNRTYYYTSDSYPDQCAVEAVCVDPGDSNHVVVLCAPAVGYVDGMRSLCESFDGGGSFQVSAEFKVSKLPKDRTFENVRVFVEPAANARNSRVVAAEPDGIFELNRLDGSMPLIYTAPGTIQDAAQVTEGGTAHYIVLENLTDEAATGLTRVKLWHTANFADSNAAIDLTGEMVKSLPRKYNMESDRTSGANYEIEKHDAVTLCATSLDRIYLGYRCLNADTTNPSSDSWQGISGLVTYDSSRDEGKRFEWAYGLRRYWNQEDVGKKVAPDANRLRARGHSDSSGYTMLGLAVDPRDDKRIALGTHIGLFYSPDIDADVGKSGTLDNVNLYPRYAVTCEDDTTNGGRAENLHEYRMCSTGLEVTMAYHVRTDPFDESHVMTCQDDLGCAHSFDGGETWSRFYTKMPAIRDTCFDAVFDEGREGVVYGSWNAKGSSAFSPSAQWYQYKSIFARSIDGGISWDEAYSSGLPENAAVVSIAVQYPRDASGAITNGERTIYVATMGFGFYVSHDSGRTFKPMNVGIPTVDCTTGGVTYPSVWARDIMVTADGRVFGMTQYSSLGPKNANGSATYHSTQDERTFGNVWEWDESANAGAGAWVKLPLNYAGAHVEDSVNVRQPRAFAYDEGTAMLYVAAVSVIGPGRTNFGGGLYAYASDPADAVGSGMAERLGAPSSPDVSGDSLTAVGFDSGGRTWLSTEDGDVYYHAGKGVAPAAGWTPAFANTLRLCSGFDFAANGDVYLSTHGVSAVRFHPKAVLEPAAVTRRVSIARAKVTLKNDSVAYNGAKQIPVVKSVVLGGKTLSPGVDYAVSSAGCMSVGTCEVTVTGTGAYKGSISATFGVTAKKVTPTVALSKTSLTYTGKPVTCGVAVWLDKAKRTKLSSSDYTVTWKNNANPGVATATVKLKGNYSGSKSVTIKVNPKGTTLSKLTAGKASFTAKWKKQAVQTSGYQLQYALNSKFKSAKTLTVKSAKTLSKKVTKLKAKKKYWVRIRTYKVVGKTNCYSGWSTKTVTTK